MAGLFGFFNYEKEGPGIDKNAPQKHGFIVFFETFFRNFWKFIPINLVYCFVSLPIITNGFAKVGITHVARNTARDKHSFGLSDFFDTIKNGVCFGMIYVCLGAMAAEREDKLLQKSGTFRENESTQERVMDSNDIERERGITILAKNTSIHYKDVKINVIDTPGHADFGGEVERVLKMVDGVVLVVDAFEGAMPQTKFVLRKALELDLSVIVCINKIDRPDARLDEIGDEVLELLLDLNATNEQLDSPMLFCSGRAGTASFDPHTPGTDLKPLLDTIIEYMPAPEGEEDEPLQVLVSAIDYH